MTETLPLVTGSWQSIGTITVVVVSAVTLNVAEPLHVAVEPPTAVTADHDGGSRSLQAAHRWSAESVVDCDRSMGPVFWKPPGPFTV